LIYNEFGDDMNIKSYKQISTMNGDQGTSKDYSNKEYSKDHELFNTLGTIDELSSFLGLAYHFSSNKSLIQDIQKHLQTMMSQIATSDTDKRNDLQILSNEELSFLEKNEQSFIEQAKIEFRFVLPGSESTQEGAYLDVCRTIARKCERQLVHFKSVTQRTDLVLLLKYLNRLSDLLFIMARKK
jgi:cob(I)alamin adenosyltransferase